MATRFYWPAVSSNEWQLHQFRVREDGVVVHWINGKRVDEIWALRPEDKPKRVSSTIRFRSTDLFPEILALNRFNAAP